jgi:hypothetical protein
MSMPRRHMGEWRYSSTFLDLGTRWRWVVSFTSLPLYPRGYRPRYPLDRRLGGPQSQSGLCGEEKNLTLPGIEPGRSSPSLFRLSYVVRSDISFLTLLLLHARAERHVGNVAATPYLLSPNVKGYESWYNSVKRFGLCYHCVLYT